MTDNLIIGLYGKQQSGKSSSAIVIAQNIRDILYPYVGTETSVQIFNFANVLKKSIINLLCVPQETIYGDVAEKNRAVAWLSHDSLSKLDPFLNNVKLGLHKDINSGQNLYSLSGRQLMQLVGKIMRTIDTDCFVKSLHREINSFFSQQGSFKVAIIDDCRMRNEVESILYASGHVIHLTRCISALNQNTDESEQASWNVLENIANDTNSQHRIHVIDNANDSKDTPYPLSYRNNELLTTTKEIIKSLF